MKICCLSDLHGYLPEVPDCDLLLLGGDYCRNHNNTDWYKNELNDWLKNIAVGSDTKIVGVAGNHDFAFQHFPNLPDLLNWDYLRDSDTTFNGLKIWGSPWQKRFFDWAFNLDEWDLAARWELIPEGTDILLLHSPPYGIGDYVEGGGNVGSPSLLRRIEEIKPKLVVFGHIHGGNGIYQLGSTTLVNAAYCNEQYKPGQAIHCIEL